MELHFYTKLVLTVQLFLVLFVIAYLLRSQDMDAFIQVKHIASSIKLKNTTEIDKDLLRDSTSISSKRLRNKRTPGIPSTYLISTAATSTVINIHESSEQSININKTVSDFKVQHNINTSSTQLEKVFQTKYNLKTEESFINVNRLLEKSTTDIGGYEVKERLLFLSGIKNPCVAINGSHFSERMAIGIAKRQGLDISCFPYFLIIGFPKSGTSDLLSRLRSGVHSLVMPKREVHFWDNKQNIAGFTLAEYSKMFTFPEVLDGKKITGEKTPAYIWYGDLWRNRTKASQNLEPTNLIPSKLNKLLPDTKLIVILRNPVNRLFSDYKYYYRHAHQERCAVDFHEKVKNAMLWWNTCLASGLTQRACAYGCIYRPLLPNLDCYSCINGDFNWTRGKCDFERTWAARCADRLRIGIYFIFIQEWFKAFPRQNFLFLKFEAYMENTTDIIVNNVLPFLGISDTRDVDISLIGRTSVKNSGSDSCSMLPQTKKLLQDFYEPYNREVEKLLGSYFRWG